MQTRARISSAFVFHLYQTQISWIGSSFTFYGGQHKHVTWIWKGSVSQSRVNVNMWRGVCVNACIIWKHDYCQIGHQWLSFMKPCDLCGLSINSFCQFIIMEISAVYFLPWRPREARDGNVLKPVNRLDGRTHPYCEEGGDVTHLVCASHSLTYDISVMPLHPNRLESDSRSWHIYTVTCGKRPGWGTETDWASMAANSDSRNRGSCVKDVRH